METIQQRRESLHTTSPQRLHEDHSWKRIGREKKKGRPRSVTRMDQIKIKMEIMYKERRSIDKNCWAEVWIHIKTTHKGIRKKYD